MLRIHTLIIRAALLLLVWIYALTQSTSPGTHAAILWAPAAAVLLFGASLAVRLIVGVTTFKTVPSEAEALQRDIARAKKELAKRGITA